MESSVRIELVNIIFSYSANTRVSSCKSPLENITYEFVLTSLKVSSMSCSSYVVGLLDGR